MKQPIFFSRKVIVPLVVLALLLCTAESWCCSVRMQVEVDLSLSTCPDFTVTEDLAVSDDLCINGTMTTIDGNVTIRGTDTLCLQSIAAESLIVSGTGAITAGDVIQHDLLNRFEVMRSNGEITNIFQFADQLDPIITTSDQVGLHVAFSADGSVAVMTSGNTGFTSARFYIFRRTATLTGSVWSCVQVVSIAHGTSPLSSVAISGDGSIIAIGAPLLVTSPGQRGAVRIYRYNESTMQWGLAQTLLNPRVSLASRFGYAMSMSHDAHTIALSDPFNSSSFIYVYTLTTRPCDALLSWQLQQELSTVTGTGFGFSMSLSPEGSFLLAGLPGSDLAILYRRTSATWQAIQTLASSSPFQPALFGASVDLAENGRYAVICGGGGAFPQNTVEIYGMDHNLKLQKQAEYTILAVLSDITNVRISYDGTVIIVNPNDTTPGFIPTVELFERYNSSWYHTASLATPANTGTSIDLSGDGSCIIWGQPGLNYPTGGATVFGAVADCMVTDLVISNSVCMERLVTVTGSLYVAGTITHGGSLGDGFRGTRVLTCNDDTIDGNRMPAVPTAVLIERIRTLARSHTLLRAQIEGCKSAESVLSSRSVP